MARNRKRAKERRSRRPQPVTSGRAEQADGSRAERETPNPIDHATPDAELAEAQLAVGRPELAPESEPGPELEPDAQALDRDELDEHLEVPGVLPERPVVQSGEVGPAASQAPEPAGHAGNRLITFIQGSWRELQRVQWPDRRQVMQATGVVIGFVIIAGAYLGVADALAAKVMDYILK